MAAKKIALSKIDLKKKLTEAQYKIICKDLDLPILKVSLKIRDEEIPTMLLLEGMDGAGKSEAIKDFTFPMASEMMTLHKINEATEDEKKYHYLARFWDRIPPKGELGIYDRTWYSRVLIDKVEKRVSPSELRRTYTEINNFEKTLTDAGYKIIKLFLHMSKDEQLKRFKERESDPLQQHKLSDADWRNRNMWDEYMEAIDIMFQKTSTSYAPWDIIASEDRNYGRLQIMKLLCDKFKIEVPNSVNKIIS